MSDLDTCPLEFFVQLETYTLDPAFEEYGNFAVPREDGSTLFHGNFADLSARFSFVLAGEEAARAEIDIRRHQRTERYLAAARRRREHLVQTWARRQRAPQKWAGPDDLTPAGHLALRLVQQGELEKAEKVMGQAS